LAKASLAQSELGQPLVDLVGLWRGLDEGQWLPCWSLPKNENKDITK